MRRGLPAVIYVAHNSSDSLAAVRIQAISLFMVQPSCVSWWLVVHLVKGVVIADEAVSELPLPTSVSFHVQTGFDPCVSVISDPALIGDVYYNGDLGARVPAYGLIPNPCHSE
jgi:hypothetical protein